MGNLAVAGNALIFQGLLYWHGSSCFKRRQAPKYKEWSRRLQILWSQEIKLQKVILSVLIQLKNICAENYNRMAEEDTNKVIFETGLPWGRGVAVGRAAVSRPVPTVLLLVEALAGSSHVAWGWRVVLAPIVVIVWVIGVWWWWQGWWRWWRGVHPCYLLTKSLWFNNNNEI